MLRAVIRLLRAAGFVARGFLSADEFLKSWHFDRPDYLVLDLQMPDRSGIEVLQALRTAGAQFPIIIFSADDAPSQREECARLGAAAFLPKPIDMDALLKAVNLGRTDS